MQQLSLFPFLLSFSPIDILPPSASTLSLRYPFVEPSMCHSRDQGEQQLNDILSAGISTFVCLQVRGVLSPDPYPERRLLYVCVPPGAWSSA